MKLYYCDTLAPRKVCTFARHVAAPVEFIHVSLEKGEHKTPAYLALNPNGKVPTLTDGEKVTWEADAILCELAQAYAPGYLPDADRQFELIKWFSWNAQHLNRWGGELYFQHLIKARFKIGPVDVAAVEEAQRFYRNYAAVLNDHLTGRKWVMGDRPTVADFSLSVTLPYRESAHLPLDGLAEIQRWHDQLNAFAGWRDPWPDLAAQAVA